MSRETDIQTAEKGVIKVLELIKRTGYDSTLNVFALLTVDEALAGAVGDYQANLFAATANLRSLYASLSNPSVAASVIYPYLLHYAQDQNWPELSDLGSLMGRRYLRYIAGALTVQSRVLTYGATTAGGGNVGTGTLECLYKDENDFEIEATAVETKTFECLTDYNLGARLGEEVFEARGQEREKYLWLPGTGGSGLLDASRSYSAGDSAAYLINPSFSQYSPSPIGAGPNTALPGWTVLSGTFANVLSVVGAGNYFRDPDGDTAQAGLKFTGNDTIYQVLGTNSVKVSALTPYHFSVAVKRLANATGNITLTLGNTTKVVTIASLTNGAWNIVSLDLDKKRWAKYFNATGLQLSIKVDTLATGTVIFDDVLFCPMQKLDGHWWTLRGGATPFLKGDVFTRAVTQADITLGIKQYWFWRATGHYLPHTAGVASDADPTF